jgi:hypothetical protein
MHSVCTKQHREEEIHTLYICGETDGYDRCMYGCTKAIDGRKDT